MTHNISEEKPPYRPWGRYVCDWRLTEAHLFNTVIEAREFAKNWERDCNVGWLAPVWCIQSGKNVKPSSNEAKHQIARSVKVIDHR